MTKATIVIAPLVLLLAGFSSAPPSCDDARGTTETNVQPVYPLASRRLGEQGKTILRVFVNSYGYPETVELHQSSGFNNLDQSATEAVKNWCFYPARTAGEPVGAWVIVPIDYRLEFHLVPDPVSPTKAP